MSLSLQNSQRVPNTRNCSLHFSWCIWKKFTSFCQVLKRCTQKKTGSFFSASRWIYADGCWNVGYPWFQRSVCVDWWNVVTTRRRRMLFCVWMCIVMQTYHVATVAYQQIIPNLTEYYRLRIISLLLLRYSYSSIPGTWYVFVTIRPHQPQSHQTLRFPLEQRYFDDLSLWSRFPLTLSISKLKVRHISTSGLFYATTEIE